MLKSDGKVKYPFFQSGSGLGGIEKLLHGLSLKAEKAFSPFLQKVIFPFVLSDLNQIVLSSSPSLVGVHTSLVRLLTHLGASAAWTERHCWGSEFGVGEIAL